DVPEVVQLGLPPLACVVRMRAYEHADVPDLGPAAPPERRHPAANEPDLVGGDEPRRAEVEEVWAGSQAHALGQLLGRPGRRAVEPRVEARGAGDDDVLGRNPVVL